MNHVSQLGLLSLSLYSAAVGVFLGMIYDFFRILRISAEPTAELKKRRPEASSEPAQKEERKMRVADRIKVSLIFAEDIVFSLICAAVISVTVFHLNSGHPRWFILLGAAVGFALYYHTAGRLVMKLCPYLILLIRFALTLIMRVTVLPVCSLFRAVFRAVASKVRGKLSIARSNAIMGRMISRAEDALGLRSAMKTSEKEVGFS